MMTDRQKKRLAGLESYARDERSKLGYGGYPAIAENKATIDMLTNIHTQKGTHGTDTLPSQNTSVWRYNQRTI